MLLATALGGIIYRGGIMEVGPGTDGRGSCGCAGRWLSLAVAHLQPLPSCRTLCPAQDPETNDDRPEVLRPGSSSGGGSTAAPSAA